MYKLFFSNILKIRDLIEFLHKYTFDMLIWIVSILPMILSYFQQVFLKKDLSHWRFSRFDFKKEEGFFTKRYKRMSFS